MSKEFWPVRTPKSFSQTSNLDLSNMNLITHEDEKSYKCDQCQQTFGDSFSRSRHLKTHSGETCAKSFGQTSDLKKHNSYRRKTIQM